jgi:flagellar motor switch protein FliG
MTTGCLRKVTILLDSLDGPDAEGLLGRLTEQQAEQVRRALAALGPVAATERRQVLDDFLQTQLWSESPRAADEGVVPPGAERAHVADGASTPLAAAGAAEPPPFAFLNQAAPEVLAQRLANEHPQTASIVLAHLRPAQAAAVLARLASDQRAEVLCRLARSDGTDTQLVDELERELEKSFPAAPTRSDRVPSGLHAVEAILQAVDGAERTVLLAELEQRDAALVQQLGFAADEAEAVIGHGGDARYPPIAESSSVGQRPAAPAARTTEVVLRRRPRDTGAGMPEIDSPSPPIPAGRGAVADEGQAAPADESGSEAEVSDEIEFNDLVGLDELSLTRLFRAAEPEVVLLALTGAPPGLADRVLQRLPVREARLLSRQMEALGPIRLRDVEHAQQQLAALARQLAAAGTIEVPASRRFTVAA